MIKLNETPEQAWIKYILPHISNKNWIDDSSPISCEIDLNKRELFSLIVYAYLQNKKSSNKGNWLVGFDDEDEEPNDGYIISDHKKLRLEHKLVPQLISEEVLNAIISIYEKQAKKGQGYAQNRILIIHVNKESDHKGLIKITELAERINNICNFDKVVTLGVVSINVPIIVIHLIKHFPNKCIAQIDFDLSSGKAEVPFCNNVSKT